MLSFLIGALSSKAPLPFLDFLDFTYLTYILWAVLLFAIGLSPEGKLYNLFSWSHSWNFIFISVFFTLQHEGLGSTSSTSRRLFQLPFFFFLVLLCQLFQAQFSIFMVMCVGRQWHSLNKEFLCVALGFLNISHAVKLGLGPFLYMVDLCSQTCQVLS